MLLPLCSLLRLVLGVAVAGVPLLLRGLVCPAGVAGVLLRLRLRLRPLRLRHAPHAPPASGGPPAFAGL